MSVRELYQGLGRNGWLDVTEMDVITGQGAIVRDPDEADDHFINKRRFDGIHMFSDNMATYLAAINLIFGNLGFLDYRRDIELAFADDRVNRKQRRHDERNAKARGLTVEEWRQHPIYRFAERATGDEDTDEDTDEDIHENEELITDIVDIPRHLTPPRVPLPVRQTPVPQIAVPRPVPTIHRPVITTPQVIPQTIPQTIVPTQQITVPRPIIPGTVIIPPIPAFNPVTWAPYVAPPPQVPIETPVVFVPQIRERPQGRIITTGPQTEIVWVDLGTRTPRERDLLHGAVQNKLHIALAHATGDKVLDVSNLREDGTGARTMPRRPPTFTGKIGLTRYPLVSNNYATYRRAFELLYNQEPEILHPIEIEMLRRAYPNW